MSPLPHPYTLRLASSATPASRLHGLRMLLTGLALAAAAAAPRAAADDRDLARASPRLACDDLPSADALLPVLNAWRAQGAACGEAGSFGAAAPLAWDDRLAQAAARQARAVAVWHQLSHRIEGDLGTRLHAAAYEPAHAAENLAQGPTTLAAAAAQWMASAAHCANLMAPRLRDAGVGCAVGVDSAGEPTRYWALVLGEPRTAVGSNVSQRMPVRR